MYNKKQIIRKSIFQCIILTIFILFIFCCLCKHSPNVGKTVAMAPALTEPISHRQSKISSPAQASSPRPIISDVTDQTQTTTVTAAATNPHHRLATQQNGGGVVVSLDDNFSAVKDTAVHTVAATVNQIENQFLVEQPQQQQQPQQEHQSPKKNNQFKSDQQDQFINSSDFQSIFVQQIQNSSNGYVDDDNKKIVLISF